MDRRAHATACGEHYVNDLRALACIRLFFFKPDLDYEEMGLKFLGDCYGVIVHG
jgi:hypothetical protein